MYFRRHSHTDAEQVEYLSMRNVSGEVIPVGGAVVYAAAASGVNFGSDITKPSTGRLGLFLGIAPEAIQSNARGRVQVAGYCAEALVIDAIGQSISIGDILVPVAGQWYLARSAAGNGTSGKVHAADDVAINPAPTAALRGVFIG